MLLSAEFDFALTPALEEALREGHSALFHDRIRALAHALVLGSTRKCAEWSTTYRVSYNSLTRQYRVASGPLGQTFESLDDVQRFIGARHVAAGGARRRARARARATKRRVREKLDVNQLPKPFQVNALASREWQLRSDWHRFSFTP